MHPGRYFEALARRLTRPDTFDRLVSPAIADLQCEAVHSRFRIRARHYIAMVAVLLCALARDFRLDIRTAFEADALRCVRCSHCRRFHWVS